MAYDSDTGTGMKKATWVEGSAKPNEPKGPPPGMHQPQVYHHHARWSSDSWSTGGWSSDGMVSASSSHREIRVMPWRRQAQDQGGGQQINFNVLPREGHGTGDYSQRPQRPQRPRDDSASHLASLFSGLAGLFEQRK